MKIAYISYAFPPDTAVGGIATYVDQVSRAMAARGHTVEVFCGSPTRASLSERNDQGVLIHRIHTVDRGSFRRDVVQHFSERHARVHFDLLESPEYGADGLFIKQQYPDLTTVVRCHTPSYFVKQLNRTYRAGSWKEWIKKTLHVGRYRKEHDAEYKLAQLAEFRASPSISLREHLANDWGLDQNRIDVVPYVFVPQAELLTIPVATHFKVVTFLGRLEVRKGVVSLGDAIPMVLRTHPDTVFRFVGRTGPAPSGRRSMVDYLRTRLAGHLDQIEFVDHVPPERIGGCLAKTDICVFPSLWENFPNVCLEAMSAARGIVASRNGGMEDMLEDIAGGILIDPASSSQLAHAVIRMLDRPLERQQMGARSRAKIVEYYAQEVARLTEEYYSAAVSPPAVRHRDAA